MKEILGKAKTVRELLKGVKYSIDYYQREYNWKTKQVHELLNDLSGKFLEEYRPEHERKQVATYPHYFLGSIIISRKDSTSFVVDGQQRLTSLTLLIVLLRNLQRDTEAKVNVDELIVSEHYGDISFNIDVPERESCMRALFEDDAASFDPSDRSESVHNLYDRYIDIEEAFPDELAGEALPYFTDWLLESVHLVEITAYSDADAYTIFETMNDRGLSLTPSDMLKGYVLANMAEERRVVANDRWRARVGALNAAGKDAEPDFFKAWLRSQYAQKIRERKKNALPEDFDRIGTEFHRWVRDAAADVGLLQADDFFRFIDREFEFYSRCYLLCIAASETLTEGLEPVYYNARTGFTLQYMLSLAPLRPDDSDETIRQKLWLVGRFVDILLTWRIWNYRSIAYSTMQYAMFLVMRDIRGLDTAALARELHRRLREEKETFTKLSDYHTGNGLTMHQQNRNHIHRILARMTDFVETKSGLDSRYDEYVRERGRNRYEVEHILANKFDRHRNEFDNEHAFAEQRNRLGGLLLLPKSFNASYGAKTYDVKREHYFGQNLLAQSLHERAYELNAGFNQFIRECGLPFEPHATFGQAELDARQELYTQLAQQVWNPDSLLERVRA